MIEFLIYNSLTRITLFCLSILVSVESYANNTEIIDSELRISLKKLTKNNTIKLLDRQFIPLKTNRLAGYIIGQVSYNNIVQSFVASVLSCANTTCLGNTKLIDIRGPVVPVGVYDLAGPAVDLRSVLSNVKPEFKTGKIDTYKTPALLLRSTRTSKHGTTSIFYILCSIEEKPTILWTKKFSQTGGSGRGYITGSFKLEKLKHDYMDIIIYQTSMPAKIDYPRMPGPPLLYRYRFSNGKYRRVQNKNYLSN